MLKVAWDKCYVLPLPPNHRFPMSKYEVLPQQLIHEGTVTEGSFFSPPDFDETIILSVHEREYFERLTSLTLSPQEIRRTGFPISQEVVTREICIAFGTIECARFALQYGVSMNIAGGTHHAFTNKGEGFCLLNDMAIAARFLLNNHLARKVLFVDLDVHQGNGSAQIFKDDDRVFTFSIHGAHNYPLIKEKSDLDVGMADGTGDRVYLQTLDENLKEVLDRVKPDFLFYQAGVDILETDSLGRLSVTREGCRQRDRVVISEAKRHRIPLVITMGGGYSRDFRDIIEAHANTFRTAQELFF